MTWQEDLAARLLQLRRQRGISQEELAEIAGVSRQAVSKWESAQSVPETEKLLAVSEYFKVSLDYLLRGEEPAPPEASARPRQAAGVLYLYAATALVWCGLLIGWAVWQQLYSSLGAAISMVAVVLALALLGVGLYTAPAPDSLRLRNRFWLLNIWPIAMLAEASALSVMLGMSWLSPTWNEHLFIYVYGNMGGGGALLVIGAWLIVCCSVAAGCYRNLRK